MLLHSGNCYFKGKCEAKSTSTACFTASSVPCSSCAENLKWTGGGLCQLNVTFSRQTRCLNANYSCFLAQSATLGDYCSTIMLLLTNLAPSQAEGSELAGQWIAGSNFFRCWRRCHQGIPGGCRKEADVTTLGQILPSPIKV